MYKEGHQTVQRYNVSIQIILFRLPKEFLEFENVLVFCSYFYIQNTTVMDKDYHRFFF